MKITLASASPRRRELLTQIGVEFDVAPAYAEEETDPSIAPASLVLINSERKAMAAQKLIGQESVIIAADTIVYINDIVLGKPKDEEEAFNMLKTLSGARHTVYTGVCVIAPPSGGNDGGKTLFTEAAEVFMRNLSDAEIEGYIKTGEPMDKAGAYGISGRGSVLISKIIGDFYTVVGLPLCRLYTELEKLGCRLF